MNVNLRGLITHTEKELSSNISILTPLFEALTNSLEAGATEIKVNLFLSEAQNDIESILKDKKFNKTLRNYEIQDNGDGFTDINLESFNIYLSSHKQLEFGCKGFGRITWLVVFDSIRINSYIENKHININLTNGYKEETDVIIKEHQTAQTSTIITFNNIQPKYRDKNILKDCKSDKEVLELIKNEVFTHLIMKLYYMDKKNKRFEITLTLGSNTVCIINQDLSEIPKEEFYLPYNHKGDKYLFKLFYMSNISKKNNFACYYCADGRTVNHEAIISTKSKNIPPFISYLISDCLDKNVNDGRTDFVFTIPLGLKNYITIDVINEEVRKLYYKIIKEQYPEIDEQNKKEMQEAIKEKPYLAPYINKNKSSIKDKDKLIEEAEKLFSKEKKEISNEFLSFRDNKNIDSDKFNKFMERVTNTQAMELAEYIAFRDQIIQVLEKHVNNNEKIESHLHNLFMNMKTDSSEGSTIDIYNNNIWLLDDKFMSYVYAASDKTIKQIKSRMGNNTESTKYNSRRPDMAIFYSAEEGKKNAVVIEFKGIGASKDEKLKAISELPGNLKIIRNEIPDINELWGFTITDLDKHLIDALDDLDYLQLSINKDFPIYYKYHSNINAHVYFYPIKAIVNDAKLRNQTFLKLISEQ